MTHDFTNGQSKLNIRIMKDFIIKYGQSIYLGAILGAMGYHALTWEFWVIFVPAIVINEIRITKIQHND